MFERTDLLMEGTWIEVRVLTKSEALEPISGIFYFYEYIKDL